MGGYNTSRGVHFREDDECKAALIYRDSPHSDPANMVDLTVTSDGETWISHASVQLDTASPPATNGAWHEASAMDCPDQNA